MKTFKRDEVADADLQKIPHTMLHMHGEFVDMYEEGDELPVLYDEVRVAKQQALAALSAHKWAVIDRGIEIDGLYIATDKNGRDTLIGAILGMQLNPDYVPEWKTDGKNEDGTSVRQELSREQMTKIANSVTSRQQLCFNVEAIKEKEIAALDNVNAIQNYMEAKLEEGWPI